MEQIINNSTMSPLSQFAPAQPVPVPVAIETAPAPINLAIADNQIPVKAEGGSTNSLTSFEFLKTINWVELIAYTAIVTAAIITARYFKQRAREQRALNYNFQIQLDSHSNQIQELFNYQKNNEIPKDSYIQNPIQTSTPQGYYGFYYN